MLLKAGYTSESAKGRYSRWSHPKLSKKIVVSGKDASHAKTY
jgi:hypothetical protein